MLNLYLGEGVVFLSNKPTCNCSVDSSLGRDSMSTSMSFAVLAISWANRLEKSSGDGEAAAGSGVAATGVPAVVIKKIKMRLLQCEISMESDK